METFGSRLELNNAVLHMDLEDTITVSAVVGHPEFAPQGVERKDIGDSTRVENIQVCALSPFVNLEMQHDGKEC